MERQQIFFPFDKIRLPQLWLAAVVAIALGYFALSPSGTMVLEQSSAGSACAHGWAGLAWRAATAWFVDCGERGAQEDS